MKPLSQIKDEVAQEHGYEAIELMYFMGGVQQLHIDKIARAYAEQFIEEAVKRGADIINDQYKEDDIRGLIVKLKAMV